MIEWLIGFVLFTFECAKVLLFSEMCKYFAKKTHIFKHFVRLFFITIYFFVGLAHNDYSVNSITL